MISCNGEPYTLKGVSIGSGEGTMQTCYRNVIRRHFPTLHDGLRRSEYSGFGEKPKQAEHRHIRSEERTLRKARKEP